MQLQLVLYCCDGTNKQQNGVTKAGVLIVSQIIMTKENNNIV